MKQILMPIEEYEELMNQSTKHNQLTDLIKLATITKEMNTALTKKNLNLLRDNENLQQQILNLKKQLSKEITNSSSYRSDAIRFKGILQTHTFYCEKHDQYYSKSYKRCYIRGNGHK